MGIDLEIYNTFADSFTAIKDGVDQELPANFLWAQESIWRFKAAVAQIAARERSVIGQSFMVETYSRYGVFAITKDSTFDGSIPKSYGHATSTVMLDGHKLKYYAVMNAASMAVADHNTVSILAHSLAKAHDWRLSIFKTFGDMEGALTINPINSVHAANYYLCTASGLDTYQERKSDKPILSVRGYTDIRMTRKGVEDLHRIQRESFADAIAFYFSGRLFYEFKEFNQVEDAATFVLGDRTQRYIETVFLPTVMMKDIASPADEREYLAWERKLLHLEPMSGVSTDDAMMVQIAKPQFGPDAKQLSESARNLMDKVFNSVMERAEEMKQAAMAKRSLTISGI